VKKRKASGAKRKRVDWRKRVAPPKGSRLRAAYERSAIYKDRQAAAAKAQRTRAKAKERQVSYGKRKERSESRKKGWRTRRAKDKARVLLRDMKELAARSATEEEWSDSFGMRDYGPPKQPWPRWGDAKQELLEATDDFDRYLEILDDLADEVGVDWDIAYSEPE
jgi:hypothetical protein